MKKVKMEESDFSQHSFQDRIKIYDQERNESRGLD
jgi:hypothetical protein